MQQRKQQGENYMKKWIISLSILLLSSCTSLSGDKTALTISAAASMKDVLLQVKKQYETDHPNITLSFNFASSGTLQKQIEQGAAVDVFISAAAEPFQALKTKGFIVSQHNDDLVYNELVLVTSNTLHVPVNSLHDLKQESIKTIAIGTPETVPAGAYAKKWLESSQMWNPLRNKFVFTNDVRQALMYVESENADAAIVYWTDAILSKNIRIVTKASNSINEQIVYKAGVIQSSPHLKEASDFLQYLKGREVEKLFKNSGFLTKTP